MASRRFILAGIVLAGALLPSMPVSAETLAGAVERALLRHPQIKAQESNQKAAGAAVRATEGLSRPRLGVSAEAGVYADPEVVDESYSFAAAASQTLYNGGQIRAEKKRTRANADAADSRLADTAAVIGLQAAQAYIEVQRSQRVVQLVKKNLSALEGIYNLIRLRVETGIGDSSELFEAKARIEATSGQLETAKQQYADSVAMFQTVIGALPSKLETMEAPRKALPGTVDEAVSQGRGLSPRITAVRYEALAADAAVGVAQSALKPKLDLELNLNYGNVIEGFEASEFQNATAMVVFKFDLFDGGTRKARVSEARHLADASRQNAETAALEVEREIRLAWNAIEASQDRLAPLKRQIAELRKALELSEQRFETGITTLEATLDLRDQVTTLEAAYLNEQSSGRYNVYRVLAATGRLFQALGINLPAVEGTPEVEGLANARS